MELLNKAIDLECNPFIGRKEDNLAFFSRGHRYVLYYYTLAKAIKIIYFVDENKKLFMLQIFSHAKVMAIELGIDKTLANTRLHCEVRKAKSPYSSNPLVGSSVFKQAACSA